MSGAILKRAKLGGFVHDLGDDWLFFPGADMTFTNLTHADLTDADFGSLCDARGESVLDFEGKNVPGANLTGANMDGAQMIGVRLVGATMPDGKVYD
jgi:uncharacterized protein YjbI with pentapeptide repeats